MTPRPLSGNEQNRKQRGGALSVLFSLPLLRLSFTRSRFSDRLSIPGGGRTSWMLKEAGKSGVGLIGAALGAERVNREGGAPERRQKEAKHGQ